MHSLSPFPALIFSSWSECNLVNWSYILSRGLWKLEPCIYWPAQTLPHLPAEHELKKKEKRHFSQGWLAYSLATGWWTKVLTSFQALGELSKGCKNMPTTLTTQAGLSRSCNGSKGSRSGCPKAGKGDQHGEERLALHRETTCSYAHTGHPVFCGSAEIKHINSHLRCRFDPSRARLSCSLGFPASS